MQWMLRYAKKDIGFIFEADIDRQAARQVSRTYSWYMSPIFNIFSLNYLSKIN